jgi:2-dehydro-3-deoxygluconokinase
LTVSCDLNFRKKLWKWRSGIAQAELAQQTMRKILPYVDVVIANEEDAQDVLGISAENTDVEGGQLDAEKYMEVAKKIVKQFPKCR